MLMNPDFWFTIGFISLTIAIVLLIKNTKIVKKDDDNEQQD